MSEDDIDKKPDPPEGAPHTSGRLGRLGRRLLDRGDDVKELAGVLLDGGDRVKTEAVRMVAREVRTYLDELKLMELVRSHSLEVHASFHLKPLAPEAVAPAPKQATPTPEKERHLAPKDRDEDPI